MTSSLENRSGAMYFQVPDRGAQLGELLVGGRAGDAEVHQVGEVVPGDQDVGGLTSRCMTPAAWAASNAEAIWVTMATARGGVRGPKRLSTLSEVRALDEPHLHVHLPVDFAVVVDGHDVGFLQSAGDAGLALHPLAKYRVLAEVVPTSA